MKLGIFNKIDIVILTNYLKKMTFKSSCDCTSCNSVCLEQIYNVGSKNIMINRCKSRKCRRRRAVINTKLSLTTLVNIIYSILLCFNSKPILLYHRVSKATIAGIKKKLINCYVVYCLKGRLF
ncbi:hypothetical protein DMUE_5675 [Dictyocoela muelleri]|nr:hypothetical protein DMUE_5675 [Dictyocoela muelleri]